MMPIPPRHASDAQNDAFHVPKWIDILGRFIDRRKPLWIRLGNLETWLLADEIADVRIERPIYVSGLARSGSTLLLELLSEHEGTATHRYRDYPPIFTPYLWQRLLERMPQREVKADERTHRDGILVTPESPEAFEEVLWMAFFPRVHDPAESNILDERTDNPPFEAFYRNHLCKLLRLRGGSRYLSKGNYNVTRLEYLLKLFPDARFLIPLRGPVWHVASFMRQHALFCEGERRNPRALEHMRRVGHYEFGLDRRPINAGDTARVAEIMALWERGEEVEGWARYWSHVYGYVADRLDANPHLRDASLVVWFEALCRAPGETIRTILDHCRLSAPDAWVERRAARIRFPSYYHPCFTPEEFALIDRHTRMIAERLIAIYNNYVKQAACNLPS